MHRRCPATDFLGTRTADLAPCPSPRPHAGLPSSCPADAKESLKDRISRLNTSNAQGTSSGRVLDKVAEAGDPSPTKSWKQRKAEKKEAAKREAEKKRQIEAEEILRAAQEQSEQQAKPDKAVRCGRG